MDCISVKVRRIIPWLIGLALALGTLMVLIGLPSKPRVAYATSVARAGVIAYVVHAYYADHHLLPPPEGRLSCALFGDNPTKTVYLNATDFPTNQAGYFLDAKQEPYQITITTGLITVVGWRGKIAVTERLEGEPLGSEPHN
jgi:hypothetical protein